MAVVPYFIFSFKFIQNSVLASSDNAQIEVYILNVLCLFRARKRV